MSKTQADSLLALVQSFFVEHLRLVRGASEHTVRAYRDALTLFFVFLADSRGRSVAALQLDDVSAQAVLAFLTHIAEIVGPSVSADRFMTREGRLEQREELDRRLSDVMRTRSSRNGERSFRTSCQLDWIRVWLDSGSGATTNSSCGPRNSTSATSERCNSADHCSENSSDVDERKGSSVRPSRLSSRRSWIR